MSVQVFVYAAIRDLLQVKKNFPNTAVMKDKPKTVSNTAATETIKAEQVLTLTAAGYKT